MSFQYCYITALIVLSPVRCIPDYLNTLATLRWLCLPWLPPPQSRRGAQRSWFVRELGFMPAEILTQTRYLTKLDFSLTFCCTVDDETCSCHSKQCGKTNLVCFANTILGFFYPALPSFISLQFLVYFQCIKNLTLTGNSHQGVSCLTTLDLPLPFCCKYCSQLFDFALLNSLFSITFRASNFYPEKETVTESRQLRHKT